MNRHRFIIKHSGGNYVARLKLAHNPHLVPLDLFMKRFNTLIEDTKSKYACSHTETTFHERKDRFHNIYTVKFFKVKP